MHCRGNKKTKLANIHDICVRIEKSLRQYMSVKLGLIWDYAILSIIKLQKQTWTQYN
jgi:hypothetical protein